MGPRARGLSLIAVLAAVIASLLMWPVLGAPHQRVYGQPSDPLGEVWRLEQFRTGEIGLVGNGVARTANAPDGVELRRALDVTQVLYDVPAVGLAKLMPSVLAYNVLVWLALWSSAVAMSWALLRLGVPWAGAAAAGIAFMAAPVHMIEAQLHVGIAMTAPFAVVLAIGIGVLRRPTARGGAVLGAAAAACAYLTAYASLQVLALLAGLAATAVAVGTARPPRRAGLAAASGAAAAAGFAVLTPLLWVLATSRDRIDAQVSRPAEDVAAFSLSPGDLVDPGASSYLGLVGIAAAVAGAAWGRGGRTLRVALVSVTLAGAWMSLSPDAPVIGALAPGAAIHEVLPYWRVYGRAEIIAVLGIAALAGLFVARLAEREGRVGGLAAALLAGAVAADVVREPPPPAVDAGVPDAAVAWLAGARGAVAEFPLYGFQDYRLGPVLLRQMRHDRPLLNGGMAGTRSAQLTGAAMEGGGAQAVAALRVAGVDRVVVHPGAAAPGLPPGRDVGGGVVGVVIPPGAAAVARIESVYPEEPRPDGAPFTWLGPGSSLRALSSCPGTVTVRFTAISHTVPRIVAIGATRVRVGTVPTPVRITILPGPAPAPELPVAMDPPPGPLPGGDPRIAGIGVSGISAAVRCG